MIVRPFAEADLAAVTDIYADSVLNGTGTFELDVPSADEMRARLAVPAALGLPVLVAEIDGQVAGYAYAGPYRLRAAYRFMTAFSADPTSSDTLKPIGTNHGQNTSQPKNTPRTEAMLAATPAIAARSLKFLKSAP